MSRALAKIALQNRAPNWPCHMEALGVNGGTAVEDRKSASGVSRNTVALQYLAMATMVIDHIGAYVFPGVLWLRAVGRIAWPIYLALFFRTADGPVVPVKLGRGGLSLPEWVKSRLLSSRSLRLLFTGLASQIVIYFLGAHQPNIVLTFWSINVLGIWSLPICLFTDYGLASWAIFAGLPASYILSVYVYGWFQSLSLVGFVLIRVKWPKLPNMPVWLWRNFYIIHLCVILCLKLAFCK